VDPNSAAVSGEDGRAEVAFGREDPEFPSVIAVIAVLTVFVFV
jgi:hypothetical protein